MVFPSILDPEDPLSVSPMASSTIKPQKPLHNFPLQDLKWSINQTSSHRFRKPADCPKKLLHVVSDESPVGDNAKAGSSSKQTDKLEKKSRVSDSPSSPHGNSGQNPNPKICIRIKAKQHKSTEVPVKQIKPAEVAAKQIKSAVKPVEELTNAANEDQDRRQLMELIEAEESIAKTWDLRPRRKLAKGSCRNGRARKVSAAVPGDAKTQASGLAESSRPKATNDAVVTERKDKDKQVKPKKTEFSIQLTKFEIEEDIYALTGSKPSRKPIKRAKHVQKQLDYLFPGMWLSSITPDMYKVHGKD